MTDDTKTPVKPVLIGVGLAAIIGVVLYALLPARDGQSDASLIQPEMTATLPAVPDVPAVAPDVAPQTPVDTAAEAETPAMPQSPAFDTFRVETDGSMVIAGRAEPGQVVDIMLADQAIGRVTADASGSFVALPFAGPSDQPRRLSLLADPDGQSIGSRTSYMVAPIAAPVVVADASTPPVTATDDAATPEQQAAAVDVISPQRPTVLQADADGVRVVQADPAPTAPQVDPNVALDAITYNPAGEVQLSGRAIGDGSVQVYIDNEPLTTSPVTQGGDWRIDLPEIDTGIYTLRIDEVDAGGDVVSRLETPFKREQAEDVAAVLAEETSARGFEVAVKTVQPGATLWAIAEENLGAGIYYVEVFAANADLIRDPDLIYPGQIFRIPDISE